MKKTWMLTPLMVALISAGLHADSHDVDDAVTDDEEVMEDFQDEGMDEPDGPSEDDLMDEQDDLPNGMPDEFEEGTDDDNGVGLPEQDGDGVMGDEDDMDSSDTDAFESDDSDSRSLLDRNRPITRAELFLYLDADGSGVITRSEAQDATELPELLEQFDDLDTGGSGFINSQEFEAFEPSDIEIR